MQSTNIGYYTRSSSNYKKEIYLVITMYCPPVSHLQYVINKPPSQPMSYTNTHVNKLVLVTLWQSIELVVVIISPAMESEYNSAIVPTII